MIKPKMPMGSETALMGILLVNGENAGVHNVR